MSDEHRTRLDGVVSRAKASGPDGAVPSAQAYDGSEYNRSLRLPVVDLAIAFVLIAAAAAIWFRSEGKETIRDSYSVLEAQRQANVEAIAETREQLREVELELDEVRQLRDMRVEHAAYLDSKIDEERTRIASARDRDAPLLAEVHALEAQLKEARRERMDYSSRLHDVQAGVTEARETVTRMETRAVEQVQQIDSKRDVLAGAPPSRFPEGNAMALVGQWQGGSAAYLLNASRGVRALGALDLGMLASVGLSQGEAEGALIEAGLYLNIPLNHGRYSIDVSSGWSYFNGRKGQGDDASTFFGTALRFAPVAHERFWLTAGVHHGHDETAFRLGIALGR